MRGGALILRARVGGRVETGAVVGAAGGNAAGATPSSPDSAPAPPEKPIFTHLLFFFKFRSLSLWYVGFMALEASKGVQDHVRQPP